MNVSPLRLDTQSVTSTSIACCLKAEQLASDRNSTADPALRHTADRLSQVPRHTVNRRQQGCLSAELQGITSRT